MKKTLTELADYVGGKVAGDGSIEILGVMTIEDAAEGYITFVSNQKYENMINETKASAVIAAPHIKNSGKPLLVVDNPYLAYAKIVDLMMNVKPAHPKTIAPGATIDKNVSLGNGVTIYPNVFVGANCSIGDNTVLYPGVYIGEDCKIGSDTEIFPNAVVYKACSIGNRVTIHSNAVIGSPSFGYAPDGKTYYKIPHVGTTVIEDDVDIEPNTTISRAALGETRIKKGAKIGCLVAVAHSVEVGENTLIVAQSGIAGSVKIGNNVTIAGQTGVSGHLKIGDNTVIGGRSGVANDLPPNGVFLGAPAMPIKKMRKCYAAIARLPEMRDTVKELTKKVATLENKMK